MSVAAAIAGPAAAVAVATVAGEARVPATPQIRGPVLAGAALLVLFLGGFLGWGALAPLSSAAIAPGHVKVEGNRKTVQHLEGGIIRAILVREGDRVAAGQVLVRLDDTHSSASEQSLRGQADALLAQEARLKAEREGQEAMLLPPDLLDRAEDPQVKEIIDGQQSIFQARRDAFIAQLAMTQQQIEQLRAEIAAYQAQVRSFKEQLGFIRQEKKSVETLLARGLDRKPRLLELQRTEAALAGDLGEKQGLIARANQGIAEKRAALAQLAEARTGEVAGDLRDVQAQLAALGEELRSASDVQHRTDIVAPMAGTVVNLRFFTAGGVIRAGDPILDIVPAAERLVVEAEIQPNDIDVVQAGQPAEVRFPAFRQRILPVIYGKVASVSADSLQNERTGATFYRAEVEIAADQLDRLGGLALQPGMPAEVFIATGERSFLGYLLSPVRDSFRRAFREQ